MATSALLYATSRLCGSELLAEAERRHRGTLCPVPEARRRTTKRRRNPPKRFRNDGQGRGREPSPDGAQPPARGSRTARKHRSLLFPPAAAPSPRSRRRSRRRLRTARSRDPREGRAGARARSALHHVPPAREEEEKGEEAASRACTRPQAT